MSWTTDIIGFAIVLYFIVRQVTPRKPTRLRFYLLPVIALIIAYRDFPRPTIPASQVEDAVISLILSIPFGIMQAYFTTLYQEHGHWLMKGDYRYLASWLALFVLHIATTVIFRPSPTSPVVVVGWIVALEVGVVWGIRSLVLHLRYPQLASLLRPSSPPTR